MQTRWSNQTLTFLVVFLSVLSATRLFSQDSGAVSTEKIFQQAMAAQDRGDLRTAEELLIGLHAKHPGIFAVEESLGLLYANQQRFDSALPFLKAAVLHQPDSDAAHANYGAALYKLHRNEEALAQFRAAARLNPKNSGTQQSLGRLLMEEHQPSAAAEAFSEALKFAQGNGDLIHDRAQALIQAGQPARAVTELSAMPDVEGSAAAQSLLGDAEEKLGSFQRAAEHYARAVELDPSELNVWTLGVEFLRHWTFDPAIKEFEAGAAKFPASTRMKLGLGAAYFGGAKYAESIPVFADLLGGDRDNAVYAELLGMACTAVTEGNKDRCDALVRFAEDHPSNAKASTYAASMLLNGVTGPDRSQEARKLLTSALAIDSKSAEAHYQLGLLRQLEGDWAGSVPDLEKAVALKTDLAPAHYRLALAYWRTGRKEQGQAEMELQKKYAKQQKADMDHRLQQITTFIVDVRD